MSNLALLLASTSKEFQQTGGSARLDLTVSCAVPPSRPLFLPLHYILVSLATVAGNHQRLISLLDRLEPLLTPVWAKGPSMLLVTRKTHSIIEGGNFQSWCPQATTANVQSKHDER